MSLQVLAAVAALTLLSCGDYVQGVSPEGLQARDIRPRAPESDQSLSSTTERILTFPSDCRKLGVAFSWNSNNESSASSMETFNILKRRFINLDGDPIVDPAPHVIPSTDTWDWIEGYSGRYDFGHDVAFLKDGRIIACGSYAAGGEGEGVAWVGQFSPSGTLRWFRTFDQKDAWDSANGISLASDGGSFVAGFTQFASRNSDAHRAFLLRLDSEGNLLWSKRLGRNPKEMHTFDSVVSLDDGGAVVLGSNFRQSGPNAWLLRFGPDSSIVWEREIPIKSLFDSYDPQSEFLCMGPNRLLYFTISNGDVAWLYAYDLDGLLVWRHRNEMSNFSSFSARGLDCDLDGVTLVGNAKAYPIKNIFWITRFDHAGRELWTRTYNEDGVEIGISAMACLEGGGTLLTGYSGGPYGGYKGWLEVLDNLGSVRGHREVAIGYENVLHSICLSTDSVFCGIGIFRPKEDSLSHIWMHRSTLGEICIR